MQGIMVEIGGDAAKLSMVLSKVDKEIRDPHHESRMPDFMGGLAKGIEKGRAGEEDCGQRDGGHGGHPEAGRH